VEENHSRMNLMDDSSKPLYRIADLPSEERPRERLRHRGANSLSNPELLAILLRVGVPGENAVQVGARLLAKYKTLSGLHRVPFDELCEQHGIGEAKAAQIKAALELGHRFKAESPEEKPAINSPADAAVLVAYEMSALEQEHLRVILLDTRNHVLDITEVYQGSVNSSQVHVGELFRAAIRRNASAIIVVHNHPSGDPTPSPDDVAVTWAILQAGKLLDVDVLDHLVIGQGQWVSLKERGLGFT
jgi:DNA repair protein RadC